MRSRCSEGKRQAVAKHEAGHVLALLASGLYDAFERVSIEAAIVEGSAADGLTLRNGDGLLKFSARILEASGKDPRSYRDLMLEDTCKVCFPHVCFFAGGEAMESCFGDNDKSRPVIDRMQFCEKVFPAMGLGQPTPSIGTYDWHETPPGDYFVWQLWNWGIGTVKGFIVGTEDLALRMADEIARRCTLLKRDMDAFLGGRAKAAELFAQLSENYRSSFDMLEQVYQSEFDKRNPWVVDLA